MISGNTATGIFVSLVDRMVIQGNRIGTNLAGDMAVPNGTGIEITNSRDNTIGGTDAGRRNVISGDTIGVEILGNSSGNVIQGRYITGASGEAAVLNTTGVRISSGASNNIVGGITPPTRNAIADDECTGTTMPREMLTIA